MEPLIKSGEANPNMGRSATPVNVLAGLVLFLQNTVGLLRKVGWDRTGNRE
jgi:hypothetical protein